MIFQGDPYRFVVPSHSQQFFFWEPERPKEFQSVHNTMAYINIYHILSYSLQNISTINFWLRPKVSIYARMYIFVASFLHCLSCSSTNFTRFRYWNTDFSPLAMLLRLVRFLVKNVWLFIHQFLLSKKHDSIMNSGITRPPTLQKPTFKHTKSCMLPAVISKKNLHLEIAQK